MRRKYVALRAGLGVSMATPHWALPGVGAFVGLDTPQVARSCSSPPPPRSAVQEAATMAAATAATTAEATVVKGLRKAGQGLRKGKNKFARIACWVVWVRHSCGRHSVRHLCVGQKLDHFVWFMSCVQLCRLGRHAPGVCVCVWGADL